MKTIGLCKALSCGDFVPAVVQPLLHELDALVFVMADTDWMGKRMENEVAGPLAAYMGKYGGYDRIHTVPCYGEMTQEDQYRCGVEYINATFDGADWILLFDTDEVWEQHQVRSLLAQAENASYYNSICCKMRTYIKSPRYRITPDEPLTPCVMVRALPGVMQGVRGNQTKPRMMASDDIFFHHYSYVRATDEEILSKANLSTYADGMQMIDTGAWYVDKWQKLPYSKNLHTTKGAEHFWQGVSVINENDVPVAVRDLDIYKNRRIEL